MISRNCSYIVVSGVLALSCLLASAAAWALGDPPRQGETITQYLTPAVLQALFPGAEKIGEVTGTPPSTLVYRDGKPVGFLFSTWDVTESRGFSNRPFVLLVGVDLGGHIAGA